MGISVVINTFNEEKNLERCISSVGNFADEIVVVDMNSTDKTQDVVKKFGAKLFLHEYARYVEPARNFAISKAKGDWIFLIDADEESTKSLNENLKKIASKNEYDYVEIPRKNIIFGKWISYSRWWPDYLIRFFKKNKVHFSDKIHVPPSKEGVGIRLESTEENALIHHNFQSVSQFLERLDRYTDIQSNELAGKGYNFHWSDLITKPSDEFFSRFFAGEGYKDGIHGLALALLQSFSELVLYLKLWEKQGFVKTEIKGLDKVINKEINNLLFWQAKTTASSLKKFLFKLKSKI